MDGIPDHRQISSVGLTVEHPEVGEKLLLPELLKIHGLRMGEIPLSLSF